MELDVWSEFEIWICVKKPLQLIFSFRRSMVHKFGGDLGAKSFFQSEARNVLVAITKSNVVSGRIV